MRRLSLTASTLALFLCLPLPAPAMEEAPTPSVLAADGWRLLVTGKAPPALFGRGPDGDVTLSAAGAAGFLARPVEPPPGPFRLRWRWRVDAAPAPTDLRRKGADDRPAAVHVFFPQGKDGGMFARLGAGLRAAVAGGPFSGRVLTYVWGGTEPAGTRFPSPYMRDDGAIIVLNGPGAPTGTWLDACVDPAADYRVAFSDDPDAPIPAPNHLALSVDTDDQGGTAESRITPPAFVTPTDTGDCP